MYNRALDKEVVDDLTSEGFTAYTKWKDVQGAGNKGPHLGDAVWPQLNNMLFLVIKTDSEREKIKSLMENIKKIHPGEGLQLFTFNVDEL